MIMARNEAECYALAMLRKDAYACPVQIYDWTLWHLVEVVASLRVMYDSWAMVGEWKSPDSSIQRALELWLAITIAKDSNEGRLQPNWFRYFWGRQFVLPHVVSTRLKWRNLPWTTTKPNNSHNDSGIDVSYTKNEGNSQRLQYIPGKGREEDFKTNFSLKKKRKKWNWC